MSDFKGLKASTLSSYKRSTLNTTLPHHLKKAKLIDLIEYTFSREKALYLACNDQRAFFTSDVYKNCNLWSCQKVCEALVYLLNNIFIRFGTKLYRQIIGIPMGTNFSCRFVPILLWERFHEVSLTGKSGWHYRGFQFRFKILCRVLVNSKFGVFYSNFLSLTPTFCKVSTEKYSKTPTFSGRQHFYSFFQNPSDNFALMIY